ncbi:MAG: hypothetical protein ACI849_001581 [Patiriisocius sp.]|jgi:hypothetical protein
MKYLSILYFLLHASICHSQFSGLKPITNTADGVRWIDAADIDGDGFNDIIAANRFGSNISWYKNVDAGNSFVSNEISFLNQTSMVTDGDLDGDIDLIASTIPDQRIVWFENLDGLGDFSPQKIISSTALNAFFLLIEDIDADGDLDVMSGGDASRIEWFENTDGLGNFGNAILIDSSVPVSRSLAMEDLDNDGDLDLVSTSSGAINVWWFENIDGLGNFATKQEVGGLGLTAIHTLLADFDNDGFIDVLAVYVALDRVVWYKNIDGTGNFSSEINISLSDKASGVSAVDIDNDGDIDVLTSSPLNPFLKWYENVGGLGTFSTPMIIESEFVGSKCLALDIDNDGDIDAIRASQNDDTIVWYENQLILSTGEAQLNTIKVHPNPADTALYVTGRKMNEISSMRFTTLLGVTLWESKVFKNTINSSSWSTGSYFLEIKNVSGQKRVIQVVKK